MKLNTKKQLTILLAQGEINDANITSLPQLQQASGVPEHTIRALDRGAKAVTFAHLCRIARVLELPSVAPLFGLEVTRAEWALSERPISAVAEAKGMSLREVARQTEIWPATINRLDRGLLGAVSVEVLEKLVAFGVHIDDLVRYRPDAREGS